jgi:hypothetical protein
MRRTHLSLYYLAGYLLFAGIALIATGQFAMRLLLSNGEYGDALPRLLGVVLLALGILVAQIVRHRLEVLYSTTLLVRALLIAIVGLGVVLTGTSYLLDRRAGGAARGAAKA